MIVIVAPSSGFGGPVGAAGGGVVPGCDGVDPPPHVAAERQRRHGAEKSRMFTNRAGISRGVTDWQSIPFDIRVAAGFSPAGTVRA